MDINQLAAMDRKLDELLAFWRKVEAVFAPPSSPPPTSEELKSVEDDLAKAMGEMPSEEDLLNWSVPGPLPSEIAAAEAEPEEP